MSIRITISHTQYNYKGDLEDVYTLSKFDTDKSVADIIDALELLHGKLNRKNDDVIILRSENKKIKVIIENTPMQYCEFSGDELYPLPL